MLKELPTNFSAQTPHSPSARDPPAPAALQGPCHNTSCGRKWPTNRQASVAGAAAAVSSQQQCCAPRAMHPCYCGARCTSRQLGRNYCALHVLVLALGEVNACWVHGLRARNYHDTSPANNWSIMLHAAHTSVHKLLLQTLLPWVLHVPGSASPAQSGKPAKTKGETPGCCFVAFGACKQDASMAYHPAAMRHLGLDWCAIVELVSIR